MAERAWHPTAVPERAPAARETSAQDGAAPTAGYLGASATAIQRHYDVGNAFYALWLDPTLTYSCALYEEREDDTLEAAQLRKLDYHVAQARAAGCRRVLEVGCGWGGLLRRLVDVHGVEHAVGLTLSRAQVEHVAAWRHPAIDVRLESWFDHRPAEPYDAVISIGALEHSARLGLTRRGKRRAHRAFFAALRDRVRPGGRISIQAIAFDRVAAFERRTGPVFGRLGTRRLEQILERARRDARAGALLSGLLRRVAPFPEGCGPLDIVEFAVVFEESTLPTLADVVDAAEGLLEIEAVRNDGWHYARTGREWLRRLEVHREEALRLVGPGVVARYERYLRLVPLVFDTCAATLLRVTLRRA